MQSLLAPGIKKIENVMRMRIKMVFILLLAGLPAISQTLEEQLGNQIDVIVDAAGDGDFTTLTKAIDSAPDNGNSEFIIFVRNGEYYEKVEIPGSKPNLTIIGENMDKTIIKYDDHNGSGKIYNGIISNRVGEAIGTFTSHTLYVEADDFTIANLTIQNSAGQVGQAVALNLSADRQVVYRCRLLGHQDTFFTGDGRTYVKESYIEGNVDFIFGGGTVLFESSLIVSNRSNSSITAASTGEHLLYGYVFKNCQVLGLNEVSGISMGRPWKPFCKVVFMDSYFGEQMNAEGWLTWSGNTHETAFYAVHNNRGPGSGFPLYPDWAQALSDEEAGLYTKENLFAKTVRTPPYSESWLPATTDDIFPVITDHSTHPIEDSLYYLPKLEKLLYNGEEITVYDPGTGVFTLDEVSSFDENLLDIVTADPDAKAIFLPPKELPGYGLIQLIARNGSSSAIFRLYISISPLSVANPVPEIAIYPNPLVGDQPLTIKLDQRPAELDISIFNILGELIDRRKLNHTGSGVFEIETHAWGDNRILFYKIRSGENEWKGKIVKLW